MGKTDEIADKQKKAAEANPLIIDGLRNRLDPLEISRQVARQFGLDDRTAYKWVTITEESFDRSRRRIAGIGIAVLVLGFAGIIAGVLLSLLKSQLVARPLLLGLAAGLPVAAVGLALGVGSRRLAR